MPPYLPLLSVRVPPTAPRLHRLAARRHELQPEPRVQSLLERRGAAPVGGDAHVGDAADELRKLGRAELGVVVEDEAVAEIDAKQYKVDLQFVGEEQKQAYVENYLD